LKRTGTAYLPLHYGRAPRWLITRMRKLAHEIASVIVDEYGTEEFLRRISDPWWFQCLGCILGYDWHSSGVTTVVTGVLKSAIDPEGHGLAVCGGKGRTSVRAPVEISHAGEEFGLSTDRIDRLRYASRMSAKVDNTAVQAGYRLYHHAFFLTEKGNWAVVQQGMSLGDRTARRYHWLSEHVGSFVVEPHDAIVGDARREVALDMTAVDSEGCRKTSVDVIREEPRKVLRMLKSVRPSHQRSLQEWMPKVQWKEYVADVLSMPQSLNWKAVKKAYEFQPQNYEELFGIRGIGPATVRGLALISELIYGEPPSWRDPVKYSFAYGGKDGVPHPVDRRAMDESVQVLRDAIQRARVGSKERLKSLQRLRGFVPRDRGVQ